MKKFKQHIQKETDRDRKLLDVLSRRSPFFVADFVNGKLTAWDSDKVYDYWCTLVSSNTTYMYSNDRPGLVIASEIEMIVDMQNNGGAWLTHDDIDKAINSIVSYRGKVIKPSDIEDLRESFGDAFNKYGVMLRGQNTMHVHSFMKRFETRMYSII